MKHVTLALLLSLSACALVEPPFGDEPPVHDGDRFTTNWACLGYDPIPDLTWSLERQNRWTPEAIRHFRSGQCRMFQPSPVTVRDLIDWFEDWEGDEAYVVQFDQNRGEVYGIVWEMNRIEGGGI